MPNLEQKMSPDSPEEWNPGYEEKRERLFSSLPAELQERWQDASLEELERVVETRTALGYETIRGYHVSNADLPVGSYLVPGRTAEGNLFYSEGLENLYGKHGGGFIYVIEGGPDNLVIDDELRWRVLHGKAKIVEKIPITKENMEKLGAKFAVCEYH